MTMIRILLRRSWLRKELPKIKVSELEETQKTAAKMIAARPMPEPQRTRNTFLVSGRNMRDGVWEKCRSDLPSLSAALI